MRTQCAQKTHLSMQTPRLRRCLALLPLLLAGTAAGQKTWYVDVAHQNCCSGTCCPGETCSGSSCDPFCAVEDAIFDASNFDTILVRPGSYDGDGDAFIDFKAKKLVIRSTDGPGTLASPVTTLTATVKINNGQEAETILEGFTINTGNATGIRCQNTCPIIKGNIITGNTDSGIRLNESSATLIDNVIVGNSAPFQAGGIRVDSTVPKTPKIVDCLIEGNTASFGNGGGLYVSAEGTIRIVNTTFRDNRAFGSGQGGGAYFEGASASISSISPPCGQIRLTAEFQNCLVTCNDAEDGGGLSFGPDSEGVIVNTTLSGNKADADEGEGGAIGTLGSCVEVHNSILWDDTAFVGPEVFVGNNADFTITYSDIEGGCTAIGEHSSSFALTCVDEPSGTVKDDDPLFVDADGPDDVECTGDEDWHVVLASPAIDTGEDSLVLPDFADLDGDSNTSEATPVDLDGRNRFLDGDGDTVVVVDMGAYEFPWCDDDTDCDDEDLCTGTETCASNQCVVSFTADCNENNREDLCDIMDAISIDCNDNLVPDECPGEGSFPAVLVNSAPKHDESWWRSQRNFAELNFACDIAPPCPGDVEIREMKEGGGFDPDISGAFTFTVKDDSGGHPRILRIDEILADPEVNLTHRKWYAVKQEGTWRWVDDFALHYVIQVGDAVNDQRVLAFDISTVIGGVPCFDCPDDRRDIDGDNRILANDIDLVIAKVPSFPVAKPGGH